MYHKYHTDIKFTLVYSSECITIKELNEKLKYIFKLYYAKEYKNMFSTGVISVDFSIDPITIQIWNINGKEYFHIHTLFNYKNNIYFKSLSTCIDYFNDQMLKYAFNYKSKSTLEKILLKLKIKLLKYLYKNL